MKHTPRRTDPTTDQLRDDDWQPRPEVIYGCGCTPERLCRGHATRRAAEHYDVPA